MDRNGINHASDKLVNDLMNTWSDCCHVNERERVVKGCLIARFICISPVLETKVCIVSRFII